MSININHCKICKSENLDKIKIGSYKLIKCKNCGIIYNNSIPSKTEHSDYYTNKYAITSSDQIRTEQRRLFRIPEQILLISEILNYKHIPASILDIGCDRGFFLDEARHYGFDAYGIEPSGSSRKYCHEQGLKVFSELNEIKNKFDIITLWHSLEHHINPLESLINLKNYLNDNGFIFIRVPDFECIWRKIFSSKWIWFQPENHYFHFTSHSLSYVLHEAGIEVLKTEHRKPNNRFTKRNFKLIRTLFGYAYQERLSLRSRIVRWYENVTGVELYAVGQIFNQGLSKKNFVIVNDRFK
jgi:SAM-dependent methyltransferase